MRDPIARALINEDDIDIRRGCIRLRIDGEWLYITNHAFNRFIERLDDRTRDIFPHIDWDKTLHLLAAFYVLLYEGRPGRLSNRKRGVVYGREAEGWFFVVEDRVVVTCYPARGFFVEESKT